MKSGKNSLKDSSHELQNAEFINNAAHEVNTHLNSIIGFADILEKGLVDQADIDKKYLGYCNNISNAGRNLRDSVNAISYYQYALRADSVALSPVNFLTALSASCSEMERYAKSCSVKLETSVPDKAIVVNSNYSAIKRLLSNAISNAISFSQKGSKVEIAVAIDQKNQKVLLDIKDQGMGMSDEQIDSAHFPFKKHARSMAKNQLGLGLSIVQEIVRLIDGEVKISSEIGVGTNFTFSMKYQSVE